MNPARTLQTGRSYTGRALTPAELAAFRALTERIEAIPPSMAAARAALVARRARITRGH